MVPHSTPAPRAASMPWSARPAGACAGDATASKTAPANMSAAPPSTPSHRRQPASRSSWKKTTLQKIPSRLFMFHNGNAMLSPMSRIANIVSVLATAQRQPANTAHTIRCGACCASAYTWLVPRASAGRLHRARKTPTTISSEISTGETPACTSLVGASAAPSHAPAASPHIIPGAASFLPRDVSNAGMAAVDVVMSPPLLEPLQQYHPPRQHDHRHPPMRIPQHDHPPALRMILLSVVHWSFLYGVRDSTTVCQVHKKEYGAGFCRGEMRLSARRYSAPGPAVLFTKDTANKVSTLTTSGYQTCATQGTGMRKRISVSLNDVGQRTVAHRPA